jgi:multicomponent K+:H+ antiporter subunit A
VRRTSSRHLQVQMLWMFVVAGAAALASALVVPLEWGDRAARAGHGGLRAALAGGRRRGHRRGLAGQVPPAVALTLLGVVGIVVCVTFAWFSAPDLALTQIAVEAVTMVLFLLGLRWLPKRIPARRSHGTARRARWRRGRDLVLALLAGAGLAALSYALLTRTGAQSISPFFLENALPRAAARNVVNVMLVDFRAFDTLGEITVLATVG